MHLLISNNSFINIQMIGLLHFNFSEKRGSKAVNMDLI